MPNTLISYSSKDKAIADAVFDQLAIKHKTISQQNNFQKSHYIPNNP